MLDEDSDKSSGKGHLNSLVSFLGTFGEVVFEDEELSKVSFPWFFGGVTDRMFSPKGY